MSETKTIVMPEGGCNDTASMMAMMNNSQCWNNPWMYLILLAMFRNGGLFGNGEGNAQISSVQDTLNAQQTNNLVMDAIKGNACAISNLASQMGCSADQITSAINGVNNMVTQMGYQNQLANCGQTNAMERGFAGINYNMATQCCETKQAIKDNTLAVVDKLSSLESDRKDREITSLTAQLASANARAERQAELAPIVSAIKDIQARQPSTATVPYPQLSVYPSYLNNVYGTQLANGQIWS